MATKKELLRTIRTAKKELDAIELAKKLKENQRCVGRCYRIGNGYNNDDRWFLYREITNLSEWGDFMGWEFQTDNDGKFTAGPVEYTYIENGKEISRETFDVEWEKQRNRVDNSKNISQEARV